MTYPRRGHYDPGDKRPHGSRGNSVGGRFIARERGAFLTPSFNKQDALRHIFLAVTEGRIPSTGLTGCCGKMYSMVAALERQESANTDFENACNDILTGF